MRLMFGWVLALSLWLGCVPARADEASRRARVEEYFRLSRIEQSYAQTMTIVMNQVWAGLAQQLRTITIGKAEESDVVAFREKLKAVVNEQVGWPRMKEDYIELYASAFTEDELDGMVAFYRSPAGQSMVAKTPELMTKSSMLAQRRMGELQPALEAAVQEFINQVAAPKSPTEAVP